MYTFDLNFPSNFFVALHKFAPNSYCIHCSIYAIVTQLSKLSMSKPPYSFILTAIAMKTFKMGPQRKYKHVRKLFFKPYANFFYTSTFIVYVSCSLENNIFIYFFYFVVGTVTSFVSTTNTSCYQLTILYHSFFQIAEKEEK